jgi:hypothetical protein
VGTLEGVSDAMVIVGTEDGGSLTSAVGALVGDSVDGATVCAYASVTMKDARISNDACLMVLFYIYVVADCVRALK